MHPDRKEDPKLKSQPFNTTGALAILTSVIVLLLLLLLLLLCLYKVDPKRPNVLPLDALSGIFHTTVSFT
jgi:uncharacterized BrkB/YihY/UPF0761 family membrane protein